MEYSEALKLVKGIALMRYPFQTPSTRVTEFVGGISIETHEPIGLDAKITVTLSENLEMTLVSEGTVRALAANEMWQAYLKTLERLFKEQS